MIRLAILISILLAGSLSFSQVPRVNVTGAVSVVRGAGASTDKSDGSGAVVWLKPVSAASGQLADRPGSSARTRFKIVQQHKRFDPHVLAIPAGSVVDLTYQNALVWNAGVATNLQPLTLPYSYSKSLGVRNGQQAGCVSNTPYPYGETLSYHPTSHAILCTGTAASAVDLNPIGYSASEALATNGTQQGGWAYNPLPAQSQHAALWSGTADTFVDLNPLGYNDSRITALTAIQQVGDGWVGPMGLPGSIRHALVWSGTADSVVDLNQFLPARTPSTSRG